MKKVFTNVLKKKSSMKRGCPLACLALVLLALASCEKASAPVVPDEPRPEVSAPQVSLSGTSFIVYPAGCNLPCEVPFSVASEKDVSMSVSSSPGVSASLVLSEGGRSGKVIVSATENLLREGNIMTLKAVSEGGESTASATFAEAFITVDRTEFSSAAAGASLMVGIRTNAGLKSNVEQTCSSWLHAGAFSGTDVAVTIDRNTGFENRSGVVTFTDSRGLLEKTLCVTQDAAINYTKLERDALVALYNSAGGQNWKAMSSTLGDRDISTANWCTDKPVSQWYGVEVGGDGHVMYVRLNDMNMEGTLPEEIGDLVYCQEFIVSDNSLTGSLPSRIGDMQALKSLQAGGNALSGDLSSSTLSKLASKLKLVSLAGNRFTGTFPEWIGDMPAQCNFWLQDNCLSGVVPLKVQNHAKWNSTAMDGSGKTIGQINMVQKEGYVLALE